MGVYFYICSFSLAAPPSGEPAASTSSSPTPIYPEHLISQLTANGCTRQQAAQELANAGGDVQKALINFLAKSISVPKTS